MDVLVIGSSPGKLKRPYGAPRCLYKTGMQHKCYNVTPWRSAPLARMYNQSQRGRVLPLSITFTLILAQDHLQTLALRFGYGTPSCEAALPMLEHFANVCGCFFSRTLAEDHNDKELAV